MSSIHDSNFRSWVSFGNNTTSVMVLLLLLGKKHFEISSNLPESNLYIYIFLITY